MARRGDGQEWGSRSLGKLSSHFVVIIDLSTICGMVYDILGIKMLDMKIMPMKVDAHFLRPNMTLDL